MAFLVTSHWLNQTTGAPLSAEAKGLPAHGMRDGQGCGTVRISASPWWVVMEMFVEGMLRLVVEKKRRYLRIHAEKTDSYFYQ